MSTAFKPIDQLQPLARKHGLEIIRMTWSPAEYRVYSSETQRSNDMVFQGDENRTSDFVTGWMARGAVNKD